jgi:hypothetical protein
MAAAPSPVGLREAAVALAVAPLLSGPRAVAVAALLPFALPPARQGLAPVRVLVNLKAAVAREDRRPA